MRVNPMPSTFHTLAADGRRERFPYDAETAERLLLEACLYHIRMTVVETRLRYGDARLTGVDT